MPTGEQQGLVAIKGVPDGSFRLPTGDGEFNTRASLYAFRDGNTFLSGGGGYNFRTRGYTDEVSYFVNAGNHLFSAFWVTGTVMGLFPAREPNIERAVGFGVGEGVEYLTAGGEIQYNFTQRGGRFWRNGYIFPSLQRSPGKATFQCLLFHSKSGSGREFLDS